MLPDRSKLPGNAFLSPEIVQACEQAARKGIYNLSPLETMWRDKQPHLRARGYSLRPRYAKGWQPSWTGTNINPYYCEDSIVSRTMHVIDARSSDGTLVAIKHAKSRGQEIEIAQFVTSTKHPHNHCVPVKDLFLDPDDSEWSFMVIPYLRPFNEPEFELIGDVIEFIAQMLEGLSFLHSNSIAHRDISSLNVMMDGRPLYPQGHHPMRIRSSIDLLEAATPLRRIDHRIEYFYIDFGLSVRLPPGASPLVLGYIGRGSKVPEISATVPWDAYKADICALGNLFHEDLYVKYRDIDFIKPLVDCMRQRQPDVRPGADELVRMFQQLCSIANPSKSRWSRLSPRSEATPERILKDAVAAARHGYQDIRRIVG
ncbi:kinase-like domain-containing protein [Lenzites betulinus]|nr:kinase-like domain-containing protein [Lenzites betulinus]